MQETVASFVHQIRALPAWALAGFIEQATAMRARGEVDEDFGDWIEVALERLDELAVEELRIDETFYLEYRGDSMAPTFRSRTLFLIDTARRELEHDAIFALRYLDGDGPFVARAAVIDGEMFFVKDNPKYISRLRLRDVQVVGRAVSYGSPV